MRRIMVSTREIAEMLGVQPRKITEYIREGMPYEQSGKRNMYFSPDLVDEWIKSRMKSNSHSETTIAHNAATV